MKKPNTNLTRRTVLGTVGGLAVAGSGLALFSGSAAAVETKFTANDTEVLTTDDGSVRKVVVETSGTISWDGLDSPAKKAEVTLEAKKDGSYTPLTTTELSVNGLSGERTFTLDAVDLTETFGDRHFESETDGKLKETAVDLRISVTVTSADGSTKGARAGDRMKVFAENQTADANVDGESDASASSYDQRYAFNQGGHQNLSDDYLATDVVVGALNVEATYGADVVTYVFRLPAAFTDGSQDNLPVVFDFDGNGTPDFQAIYHASNGVSYVEKTDSGWESRTPSDISISVNDASDAITVQVDRSRLSSTYRFGFRLGYAGGSAANYDTISYPDGITGTNFAMYTVPMTEVGDYFDSSADYVTESL